LSRFSEVLSFA